jgi:hypothetical protein
VREVCQTVTVIFCDVTGSTALGEQIDPESLRDVQSPYFDAMHEAIKRHGRPGPEHRWLATPLAERLRDTLTAVDALLD